MSRRTLTLIAATSLAIAGALGIQSAAQAATRASGATLTLSVRVASKTTHAVLKCEPAGGTHPTAAAACTALSGVNGNVTALPPGTGVACASVYQPAVATASGRWHGRTVTYRHTFSNTCALHVATGVVFTF